MKLQYQLWLIFSCLFLVISVITYILLSHSYEQRLQASQEQITLTQLNTILPPLKATYPYQPRRSLGYLQSFSAELDSRFIMLDDQMRVFADSFNELAANSTLNLAILQQQQLPATLFSYTTSFGYVQHTLLSFDTYEATGYVLVIQDANPLYEEFHSFQDSIIRLLLIAVAVFFICSYVVSTWFSKPIRQIISTLRGITPHQRVFAMPYKRRDEINELIVALQHMVSQLNQYDERQRQFLSTSSHELKTPLTAIQLITENLPLVREDEQTFAEFTQDLSFQTHKMKQMVDQLLHINRLWNARLTYSTLTTQEIQEHVLHSFQSVAQDKEIPLHFNVEPLTLYVDRPLFLRGIDNLVSNAIRYSPNGKPVSLTIQKESNKQPPHYTIRICDQGIGIAEKDLPYLYDPFYRSDEATAWNQEGSGLGLTIVKQMIDLHKGKITIQTEQGKGTCVQLFLN